MSTFTWFAIIASCIIVYLAVARQTGFKILSSPNGVSRFGSVNGKGIWDKMYANKDDDGKKLALYIATIVIAYALAHVAPEGKELVWRGASALILLHFIWTFSSGEASKLTWFIVGGMLAYFVLAFAYPKDAPRILDAIWGYSQKVMGSTADIVVAANDNYCKAPSAAETELPLTKTIAVSIPTDDVVVFTAPQGYRLSSMECPAENVIEIQLPGTKSVLQQIDCAGQITIRENEVLNKEFVVFQKPGSDEPSQVITWWKKV